MTDHLSIVSHNRKNVADSLTHPRRYEIKEAKGQ